MNPPFGAAGNTAADGGGGGGGRGIQRHADLREDAVGQYDHALTSAARSHTRVEFMRQYAWSAYEGAYEWRCTECGAEWSLFPVAPPNPDGVLEIAVHAGGQTMAVPLGLEISEEQCGICHVWWQ